MDVDLSGFSIETEALSLRRSLLKWYGEQGRDVALATNARSLRHLDLGDYASADAG